MLRSICQGNKQVCGPSQSKQVVVTSCAELLFFRKLFHISCKWPVLEIKLDNRLSWVEKGTMLCFTIG